MQHLNVGLVKLPSLLRNVKEGIALGIHILFMINRAEDELSLIPCLKLLQSIFSSPFTADYFYVNDLDCLIDIIIREILGLPLDSETRTEYLKVLYGLLKNCTAYYQRMHRKEEINKIVSRMATSDTLLPGSREWAKKLAADFKDILW